MHPFLHFLEEGTETWVGGDLLGKDRQVIPQGLLAAGYGQMLEGWVIRKSLSHLVGTTYFVVDFNLVSH